MSAKGSKCPNETPEMNGPLCRTLMLTDYKIFNFNSPLDNMGHIKRVASLDSDKYQLAVKTKTKQNKTNQIKVVL